MKLISYIKEEHEQLAILFGDTLFDMDSLNPELPSSMGMFLNYWEDYFPLAKQINESIEQGQMTMNRGSSVENKTLLSPVPLPASCRRLTLPGGNNGSGSGVNANINKPFIQLMDHHAVQGPGEVSCMPDHLDGLHIELSVGIVVGANCKNVTVEEADQYIAGYLLMTTIRSGDNIFGREVAHVLGPLFLTPDEMEAFKQPLEDDQPGNLFDLDISIQVNGESLLSFNLSGLTLSFAEVLETAAYGTNLQAGDIVGVDTNLRQAIKQGDVIEVNAGGLGNAVIEITADESSFSLGKS